MHTRVYLRKVEELPVLVMFEYFKIGFKICLVLNGGALLWVNNGVLYV